MFSVRRSKGLVAGLLSLPLLAGALPAAADLEADLELMLGWFEGRFDNYWQAREEAEAEVEHPHGRVHSIFKRVDLPVVGENVFYVQQYSDGDPKKIYRQRLYSFVANEEKEAIELVIYAPPDTAAVVDAHLDPAKLAGLTLDDLRSYPGCEVYWQRQGTEFIGATEPDACRVVSQRSGRTLVISDDLKLTANEIWIQDRAVDDEGNYVYGHQGGVPHKLWRARSFGCWAAVPKDDGSDDWDSWRSIRVHDQGGRFEMVPEGSDEGRYSFELFQAVYRGENTVPILELAVREKGRERSIAYSWASPDSERIGINLRRVQVGCTAE